jgi:type II secretory pathway component GspD/PulD (secretin)
MLPARATAVLLPLALGSASALTLGPTLVWGLESTAQAQPAQTQAAAVHLKIYPLALTEFDTAAEVVRGLLSAEGKLVEDRRNQRLIVYDRLDVHERIAAALRRISVPLRNIRIRVTSGATASAIKEGVSVAGSGRSGDVTVRVGEQPPPSAVEVRGGARRSRSRVSSQQELLVVSGGRASISVAEQVPHRDWLWSWGGANGLWSAASGISWREVGASLIVQPTVIGEDAVRVRLTPEFSYFLDRDRLHTEVHQLTTEVVAMSGAELDLGGIPMRDAAFLEHFMMGYDEAGQTERVDLRLRATIE